MAKVYHTMVNGICTICEDYSENYRYSMTLDEEIPKCKLKIDNCQNYYWSSFYGIFTCYQCSNGYFMIPGYKATAGGDFTRSDLYCKQCPPHCASCEHSSWCTGCRDAHTFWRDGECLQCHPDCDSCSGPGSDQCLVCADGGRAYRGSCSDREGRLEREPGLWHMQFLTHDSHLRFHSVVLVVILGMAVLSISMRIFMCLHGVYEDRQYGVRRERQKNLWREKKVELKARDLSSKLIKRISKSKNVSNKPGVDPRNTFASDKLNVMSTK